MKRCGSSGYLWRFFSSVNSPKTKAMTKLKYFALGVISALLVVLIMGAAPTAEKTNKPDVQSANGTGKYVMMTTNGDCYRLNTETGEVAKFWYAGGLKKASSY